MSIRENDKTRNTTTNAGRDVDRTDRDANPDPITGTPGSHPVSTGVGAAAAGAAGAAIGSVVPGIGTAIGGVVGAVVGAVGGGLAGKAVGEAIDPTETDRYWSERHASRKGIKTGTTFENYRPAYRHGAELAATGGAYNDDSARTAWVEKHQATSGLSYDEAKGAIRDEFDRHIQLREERLRADKERVQTGAVNVRKEVTTETQNIQVPVEREEVVIERRAVSGAHPGQAGAIGKTDEIRIPVSEERVNVSKDTVVTGEVDISKRKVTENQNVTGEVRKENLQVDREGKPRVNQKQ